jgi:hypothetical protein
MFIGTENLEKNANSDTQSCFRLQTEHGTTIFSQRQRVLLRVSDCRFGVMFYQEGTEGRRIPVMSAFTASAQGRRRQRRRPSSRSAVSRSELGQPA